MLSAETIAISLLATGLLLAPGFLLARVSLPRPIPYLPAWVLGPAVGLALVPIGWELITAVGLRWASWGALVVCALAAVAVIASAVRARLAPTPAATTAPMPRWATVGLFSLLVVSLITRLAAIRDLAYPAWVDSPHHALIVRLMATVGQVPTSFAPLMPEVTTFSYHFGFHASAVFFHWTSGLSEADSLLAFGQILNALTPLSVYAVAVALTRRPGLALLAAAISSLISVFPGYYATWGRYTQLTGLLILGPALAMIQAVAEPEGLLFDGGRRTADRGRWLGASLLLALLISGLVFAHYRVVAFAATFGVASLLVTPRLDGRFWALTTLITLALCGPWLWHLVEIWVAPRLTDPSSYLAPGDYNRFPWEYFNSPLEIAWWSVAGVGALIGLVRRERAIWTVGVWAALTLGLLNIPGAGTWVVNNNAWAISAFMPGSIAAAYGLLQAGAALRWLWQPGTSWRRTFLRQNLAAVLAFGLTVGVVAGVVRGLQRQANIINPVTVLARPADRAALAWMRTHLPADAVIAVNPFYWLDGIWSASDGGIWIWPELGLRTTTPPASYYFEPGWTVEINAWNARWAAITTGDSPEALALLREVGATHIYLGPRDGTLNADLFSDPLHYQPVYQQEGVVILNIK